MTERFEQIVCKLKCGNEEGTAFLISDKLAITATHAIEEYSEQNDILLNFFNLEEHCKIIKAKPLEVSLDYPLTVLQLEEIVELNHYPKFYDYQIIRKDNFGVFGYPVAVLNFGDWIDGTISRVINNNSLPYDANILLNFDSNIKEFEGLSGAPLIVKNMIVGIILTEISDGKAISIQALGMNRIKPILSDLNMNSFVLKPYNSKIKHKLENKDKYRDNTFVQMLESSNVLEHMRFQEHFYNAEIAKSAIDSKRVESEIEDYKMVTSNIKEIWETEHDVCKEENDGKVLLNQMERKIEMLSRTTLNGDGNLSLIVQKGMLQQLADKKEVGWVKNFTEKLEMYLKRKGVK